MVKRSQKITVNNRKTYQVLRSPVITEKSTGGVSQQRYTFEVDKDARKPEIAAAVEALFKVEVAKVAVMNFLGKNKRFRGIPGKTDAFRKAVVRLKSGSIDLGGKI